MVSLQVDKYLRLNCKIQCCLLENHFLSIQWRNVIWFIPVLSLRSVYYHILPLVSFLYNKCKSEIRVWKDAVAAGHNQVTIPVTMVFISISCDCWGCYPAISLILFLMLKIWSCILITGTIASLRQLCMVLVSLLFFLPMADLLFCYSLNFVLYICYCSIWILIIMLESAYGYA